MIVGIPTETKTREYRVGINPGGVQTGDIFIYDEKVARPEFRRLLAPSRDSDRAIVAFNAHVTADPRVTNVQLTVRDGMMLAYKR